MTDSSNDPVASRDLAERNAMIRTLDQVKAIAEFSPDGTLLHANPIFLEIFGYSLEEVRGARHAIFCDPAVVDAGPYHAFWQRLAGQYPATVLNGYTATHPAVTYRLSVIDKTIAEIKAKQAAKKPLVP